MRSEPGQALVTVELDHVFVCTAVDAPEAGLLANLGLAEGTPNSHPGQGTANRRFFFRSAMLELLWVRDEQEARSPVVAPTLLWERWWRRSTGYSPFGVCFRPKERGATIGPADLPFETWAYRPPYLPPELHIAVAAGTTANEPMLFVIPFGGRPDIVPVEHRQPLDHPGGFGEITALEITLPRHEPTSGAVRAVHEAGLMSFSAGEDHLAEIELDYARRGRSVDLRPALPLRLRW